MTPHGRRGCMPAHVSPLPLRPLPCALRACLHQTLPHRLPCSCAQATDYSSYKKEEYKKEYPEPTELDMDVFLSLINGVNGHKSKTEYDNGVIQVRGGSR